MEELLGNSKEYDLENVKELEYSPLKGKSMLFLGSSITYGYGSEALAFPEYLGKRNSMTILKEAVSGTTLCDNEESYIRRLKKVDTSLHFDLFMCQLSTNDVGWNKPLGEISKSFNIDDFNQDTIAGAIEYIIGYVKKVFNAQVSFYTSPYYGNEMYFKMTQLLNDIKKKWNIIVVDMYNDKEFNNISKDTFNLYMKDPIHPTKAGYLKWFTPKMEEVLYKEVK